MILDSEKLTLIMENIIRGKLQTKFSTKASSILLKTTISKFHFQMYNCLLTMQTKKKLKHNSFIFNSNAPFVINLSK